MASKCGLMCHVVLLLLCHVHLSIQQDPIVMDPVNTQAAVGTDAVFYCKVRSGQGLLVYWIVNRSIAIGPNANSNQALPKYEIFGNAIQGYYNLRIKNVTFDDANQYDCLVDVQGGGTNIERGATLNVVSTAVMPSNPNPDCLGAPLGEIEMEEGQVLENYRCTSMGGIPLGELKWSLLRSDQTLVDVDFDTQVEPLSSITATSSSYTLSAEDHESQLACSLTHPRLDAEGTCTVPSGTAKIIVRHFPIVTFGPRLDVHYLESKNETIRCSATSYPALSPSVPELTFSDPGMMLSSTVEMVEEGVIEAVIQLSQRSDVGKYINCTASNAMGSTTVTIEIELRRVLPGWLLIVVLIAACVLVLFLSLCCCYCCCNGCKPKPADDHPDLGDIKAAGYDVNESRSASVFQPNGLNGTDHRPMDHDVDSFTDIPLNDYTDHPPPPPPASEPPPAPAFNDHETGEVNDGYLSPDADERFPPMIEDEHLMGEKRISTFKPDDEMVNGYASPPPPPPPPLDLEPPKPIPSIEDD